MHGMQYTDLIPPNPMHVTLQYYHVIPLMALSSWMVKERTKWCILSTTICWHITPGPQKLWGGKEQAQLLLASNPGPLSLRAKKRSRIRDFLSLFLPFHRGEGPGYRLNCYIPVHAACRTWSNNQNSDNVFAIRGHLPTHILLWYDRHSVAFLNIIKRLIIIFPLISHALDVCHDSTHN